MPTDLPPDYKPAGPKPGDGKAPNPVPTPPGEDAKDQGAAQPHGGPGRPGETKGDVVDPPGWQEPSRGPDGEPLGVPTPAGTPTF